MDTLTLSESGEPTLALNLGEILNMAKQLTSKLVGVLTNDSLLHDRAVREGLAIADWVAVKVDAIDADLFRRINRPMPILELEENWVGLLQFRQCYAEHLAVQTMLLTDWSNPEQVAYIQWMQALLPDEIQLNTPTRPCPLTHQREARGNHTPDVCPYPTWQLKRVQTAFLEAFGDRIEQITDIPVRHPLLKQ